MNGSGKVTIKSSIAIAGSGTSLPIECTADFNTIPTHLHQIYFDAFSHQYNSQVIVHNNTEPLTIEKEKSKWRLNKIVNIILSAIKSKN